MTPSLEIYTQYRSIRVSTEAHDAEDVRDGAVKTVALPVLSAAGVSAKEPFPKMLLDDYDIVFITPEAYWDDIDVFLLGEKHLTEQCHKLNGAFIRAVGGDRATVFLESVPSMSEPTQEKQEERRRDLGLSCTTTLLGWDASEETRELLLIKEGSTEEGLASSQKEIKKALKKLISIPRKLKRCVLWPALMRQTKNYVEYLVMLPSSAIL